MLTRFERLMEQAVEGSLRRVFPTALQPVQLAKSAARAMEQAQVIGIRGKEVPNFYELRLAPPDMSRFGAYSTTLQQQVSTYLADYARERGLRPVAALRVVLMEDESVRPGTLRADARFVDLSPDARREIDSAIEGTRRLRLGDLAAAESGNATPSGSSLRLSDRLGLDFELDPNAGLVRLGRAIDNDIVLNNQRVSRYHAQLRWVESTWLVYDLDSTNGTWIDDERVLASGPRAVAPGARLKFGDHEVEVNAIEAERGPA